MAKLQLILLLLIRSGPLVFDSLLCNKLKVCVAVWQVW